MHQLKHKDFIETPLINLCREVVASADSLEDGIEFQAISAQILHSLFLQMTGAQEQKMKCICWDLATEDYGYRYERFNRWDLGECSRLIDKNTVFGDVVRAIRKIKPAFKVFGSTPDKTLFFNNLCNQSKSLFVSSNLAKAYPEKYREFEDIVDKLDINNIAAGDQQIFTGSDDDELDSIKPDHVLSATYSLLYKHRNRCAHNTLSYQQNIPTLDDLSDTNSQLYYNIFLFIAILFFIDELSIRVYKQFQKAFNRI